MDYLNGYKKKIVKIQKKNIQKKMSKELEVVNSAFAKCYESTDVKESKI